MTYLILGAVVLAVALSVRLMLRWTIGKRAAAANRARNLRWRVRLRLRPGAGYASMTELVIRWGRGRAVIHGKRGRPSLPLSARVLQPATVMAVRYGRAQLGYTVYGRLEDMVLIIAPPRIGKTGLLADRIISHPGAVLATTTRPDLVDLTAFLRSGRGPVHVFNPQDIGGIASTFAWNLLDGCEDPAVAFRRAAALVGGVHKHGDMAFWLEKAAAALAALLHAGALGGRTIIDVYAWTNRHGDEAAAEILSTDPRGSKVLLSVLAEIQRGGGSGRGPAESMRMTMSRSLSWVAIPAIASSATPGATGEFDIGDFINRNGTLYLIAADAENSPVAPLFRAFASEVHYVAGLQGSYRKGRRLDPPVLFALDEVAQIAPVPLPEWMSDSAGKGILICAVAHGLSQLEDRWGREGGRTIWGTCGVKIMMGGISDDETLESVSRLCGTVDLTDSDRKETVRVLPPELLRQLPDWRAAIIRVNLSPVIVKIRPAWKRRDVRHAPAYALRPVLRPAAVPVMPSAAAARARLAEFTSGPPTQAPAQPQHANGNGHANGDGRPPAWIRDTDGR